MSPSAIVPNVVLAKEQKAFAFDRTIPPVAEIDPGTVVRFETGDAAYERLSKGESVDAIGLETFNAVTGPVFVRGAQPGDALVVEVLDVEIHRSWSVWMPDFGCFGKQTTTVQAHQIPLDGGVARISDRIVVPIEPMIGCLAVAPKEGKGSTFMPAYHFGGNMDLRELSPGMTCRLPVEVEGGLVSAGDLHAAMGTGEPTWVSLESAGAATLRISLEKGANLPTPRLRKGNLTYCLGLGDTLELAHQAAADQAWELLVRDFGLAPFEAYAYASAKLEMRLGGPASPMVLAVVPDPF
jgi:amidase